MSDMSTKRFRIIVSLAVLFVFAVFVICIIYTHPEDLSSDTVAISTIDPDDTVPVRFCLSLKRHIFKPTQIEGIMIFDGKEYKSLSSFGIAYNAYNANSFIENFRLKHQKYQYDLFVRSNLVGSQMKMLDDTITILEYSNNMILILKSDSDNSTTYSIMLQN